MARRSFAVIALLVIASMVLTACGGAGDGGGDDAKIIKIATQSPLSGDMSVVGVDIKRGAELGMEQMGTALTEMGFKIELAPFDDQGNPDTGVANAKQIVSDPAILCVVGHYNSGVQIPSSEEYHNAGLANVSPANTNPKVTDRGYLEVNRIVFAAAVARIHAPEPGRAVEESGGPRASSSACLPRARAGVVPP